MPKVLRDLLLVGYAYNWLLKEAYAPAKLSTVSSFFSYEKKKQLLQSSSLLPYGNYAFKPYML